MGSIRDILDAFRELESLVDIPKAWKEALDNSHKPTAWYPAHVSCQVCSKQPRGHCSMQHALR